MSELSKDQLGLLHKITILRNQKDDLLRTLQAIGENHYDGEATDEEEVTHDISNDAAHETLVEIIEDARAAVERCR